MRLISCPRPPRREQRLGTTSVDPVRSDAPERAAGSATGLWLSVFPHNEAAIALYRMFRFAEEGRRTKHMRRANGELWDLVDMGLLL
jgi:ribosomal protein S18 acetylase RimI-like enzyme